VHSWLNNEDTSTANIACFPLLPYTPAGSKASMFLRWLSDKTNLLQSIVVLENLVQQGLTLEKKVG